MNMLWLRFVSQFIQCILKIKIKQKKYIVCFITVNLKNAVDFLEFAETYSAQQLKKSCLQFICVNSACFLEARYDFMHSEHVHIL